MDLVFTMAVATNSHAEAYGYDQRGQFKQSSVCGVLLMEILGTGVKPYFANILLWQNCLSGSCPAAEGTDMAHDDALGEEITTEEANVLKAFILEQMTGQAVQEDMELRFPGSQPVSLARSNLALLNKRRYWVTWKVDLFAQRC